MTALGLEQVDLCPWALREGIILGRLDQVQPSGAMLSVGGPLATGRPTLREAR
jgi:exopolyphosphatase/guanosine-5'-triphosphate,3'-diphosphate pyrophosphatase